MPEGQSQVQAMVDSQSQIAKTILLLCEIEGGEESFRKEKYDQICDLIRQTKSSLALLGRAPEAELLHECEGLFQKCLFDSAFHQHIVHLVLDFLTELRKSLQSPGEGPGRLKKLATCFACIQKTGFTARCYEQPGTVCEPEARAGGEEERAVWVGTNRKFEDMLLRYDWKFTRYSAPHEVFASGDPLLNVSTFFLAADPALPDLLLFVRVLNGLHPEVPVYLVSNGAAPNFSQVCDLHKLSFEFFGDDSQRLYEILRSGGERQLRRPA